MTELLFHQHSYMQEFEGTVTDVLDSGVALDRTAFYIGGGGQPSAGRFAANAQGITGKVDVVIEHRNAPPGTRTHTRTQGDVDAETITGYALQGAQ